MARRKKSDGGPGGMIILAAVVILALLACFGPAILAFYLVNERNKKIPDNISGSGMTKFFSYLIGIPLLISGFLVAGEILGNKAPVNNPDTWYPMLLGLGWTLPLLGIYLFILSKINEKFNGSLMYMAKLDEVISDKDLSNSEVDQLEKIKKDFNLGNEVLDQIHKETYIASLYDYLEDDLKIDSKERTLLDQLSNKLGIHNDCIEYANCFESEIREMRDILIGKKEGINCDKFIPKKNERCISLLEVNLFENVKDSVFLGASVSFKKVLPLGDLLSPRIYGGKPIRYSSLKTVDTGYVAITTNRIVFIGNSMTREYKISDIVSFDVGNDGVQIHRVKKKKKEIYQFSPVNKQIFVSIINILLFGDLKKLEAESKEKKTNHETEITNHYEFFCILGSLFVINCDGSVLEEEKLVLEEFFVKEKDFHNKTIRSELVQLAEKVLTDKNLNLNIYFKKLSIKLSDQEKKNGLSLFIKIANADMSLHPDEESNIRFIAHCMGVSKGHITRKINDCYWDKKQPKAA
jgi:uncharacterized tellurite resistance protein B-like protein